MASTPIETGPVGRRVAAAVASARDDRRLKQQELAARVTAVGRPMTASAVSKIEKMDRRVDVDDLVALAVALNVSPVALLVPQPTGDNDRGDVFELCGRRVARVVDAWRWSHGESALPEGYDYDDLEVAADKQAEYERLSLSRRQRYLRSRPASRAADRLREDVARAVEISQFTTSRQPDEFSQRLARARVSLAQLAVELDRMETEHAELTSASDASNGEER